MASPGFIPRDRLLAIAGVVVNTVGLVLASGAIQHEDPLQTANVVLAIAAWIPTAITGLIASVALLKRRRWGMVVAIVALSLQLLTLVPYGIVRLALVSTDRGIWSVVIGSILVEAILLTVYWSRALGRYHR
ncbi:MAG: Hepatitis C virus core protein [Synechococcus sp.]|nr:Hepatitis C virus core protein [Synechococcus sp.]